MERTRAWKMRVRDLKRRMRRMRRNARRTRRVRMPGIAGKTRETMEIVTMTKSNQFLAARIAENVTGRMAVMERAVSRRVPRQSERARPQHQRHDDDDDMMVGARIGAQTVPGFGPEALEPVGKQVGHELQQEHLQRDRTHQRASQ